MDLAIDNGESLQSHLINVGPHSNLVKLLDRNGLQFSPYSAFMLLVCFLQFFLPCTLHGERSFKRVIYNLESRLKPSVGWQRNAIKIDRSCFVHDSKKLISNKQCLKKNVNNSTVPASMHLAPLVVVRLAACFSSRVP